MFTTIFLLFSSIRQGFRTRVALQVEILALRHHFLVLQSSNRGHRLLLGRADRLVWVWLSRLWSSWRSALMIVKPETVIAWHRQGFRLYWRWKSRHPLGRPSVSHEVIDLIYKMSLANPRWGAPRIHGELLKLGFELSQATVAKYMVHRRKPPSQTWRTFLQNHTKDLVAADFFVVPTVFFDLLFVFVILSHDRRRVVHLAITEHPTVEWAARQLLEERVRRAEAGSSETIEGAGEGERETQATGGGAVAGEASSQGCSGGKLLSPERRRCAVEHAREEHQLSERHACHLLGQWRGTQRYLPIKRTDEDALTRTIIALASEYGRYGYRRVTALLREEGWHVGKDRVQ